MGTKVELYDKKKLKKKDKLNVAEDKNVKNKLAHSRMLPKKVKKAKTKAQGGIIKMNSGGLAKRGYGKARQ